MKNITPFFRFLNFVVAHGTIQRKEARATTDRKIIVLFLSKLTDKWAVSKLFGIKCCTIGVNLLKGMIFLTKKSRMWKLQYCWNHCYSSSRAIVILNHTKKNYGKIKRKTILTNLLRVFLPSGMCAWTKPITHYETPQSVRTMDIERNIRGLAYSSLWFVLP